MNSTFKRKDTDFYMRCARASAERSHAKRKKVGCVIVTPNNVMVPGYNGTPKGHPNECEDLVDGVLVTKPTVIHAERNALRWMTRQGISSEGSSVFLTLSPCVVCAQHLIDVGIKELYFEEEYRDNSGIALLNSEGIYVEKF